MNLLTNYYHLLSYKTRYYNSSDSYAVHRLSSGIRHLISAKKKKEQPLVFLCIGTDRATGDCLGPLVGYKLKNTLDGVIVLGSLNAPVHAKNLSKVVEYLNEQDPKPFVVAIDACLGATDHIGYVTLSPTGLKPGEGVAKRLPEVGDISITGIVNHSVSANSFILQSTRLNTVMQLADVISAALIHSL